MRPLAPTTPTRPLPFPWPFPFPKNWSDPGSHSDSSLATGVSRSDVGAPARIALSPSVFGDEVDQLRQLRRDRGLGHGGIHRVAAPVDADVVLVAVGARGGGGRLALEL